MTKPRFIHLRVHTEHSLLEGAVPVKKLIKLAKAADMPAVAVTDTNNLFAALEFSVTALGEGVQPIIGCQIALAYEVAATGEKARLSAPVVLLAQNEAGYLNLMKLNSCLYIDKAGALPEVTLEELEAYSAGLICLTGGADGPVGRMCSRGICPKRGRCWTGWRAAFPGGFMWNCSGIRARAALCPRQRRRRRRRWSPSPMILAYRW